MFHAEDITYEGGLPGVLYEACSPPFGIEVSLSMMVYRNTWIIVERGSNRDDMPSHRDSLPLTHCGRGVLEILRGRHLRRDHSNCVDLAAQIPVRSRQRCGLSSSRSSMRPLLVRSASRSATGAGVTRDEARHGKVLDVAPFRGLPRHTADMKSDGSHDDPPREHVLFA